MPQWEVSRVRQPCCSCTKAQWVWGGQVPLLASPSRLSFHRHWDKKEKKMGWGFNSVAYVLA